MAADSGLRLRAWRPLRRNSLRGFANISVDRWGLEIDDVPVHRAGPRSWASLPGRPMLDAAGELMRDERGKVRYASPFRWRTHGVAARFGAAVVKLVEAEHPGALADDEAAA